MRYKQDIRTGSGVYCIVFVSGESKKHEVMVESVDYSGKEESNKGNFLIQSLQTLNLLALTGGSRRGMRRQSGSYRTGN
ncbi:MAG: hypothetical protein ACLVCH_11905 [Roseburia inulinivorans]